MSDVLSNVVRMMFRIIFTLCMSNDLEHSIYPRTYWSIVEMIYRDGSMEIVKKTFVKYGNCQYEFVKHGICQVDKKYKEM